MESVRIKICMQTMSWCFNDHKTMHVWGGRGRNLGRSSPHTSPQGASPKYSAVRNWKKWTRILAHRLAPAQCKGGSVSGLIRGSLLYSRTTVATKLSEEGSRIQNYYILPTLLNFQPKLDMQRNKKVKQSTENNYAWAKILNLAKISNHFYECVQNIQGK